MKKTVKRILAALLVAVMLVGIAPIGGIDLSVKSSAMLNIGRTTAYQLVKQEEFRIVHIGNAIRVSKKSFDEWLESLEL